ncbi:hypothetical protein D3C84_717970 [compost metagenome]
MLGNSCAQPSLCGTEIMETLLANHSKVRNWFGFFIPTASFLVNSVALIAPSHEITWLPTGGVELSLDPTNVDGGRCSSLAEVVASDRR